MKQLNMLNSPSKGNTLKKVAKLENGIRKVDVKEKASKLQAIFKNGVATSGIDSKISLKIRSKINQIYLIWLNFK